MKTHLNGDWGISIGPPALGSPLSGGVALPFDQYHLVSARNMFNFDFKLNLWRNLANLDSFSPKALLSLKIDRHSQKQNLSNTHA
jgi:hypothetical protein